MAKGKQKFEKKDKWEGLPEGFREKIEQSTTDEIRKVVSQVALLDAEEHALLKSDPDVAQKREELKNLTEPYRENFKSYKLQIEFARQVLADKGGGATPAKQ